MAWCSKNHRNNKSMWCFCFERFCFHKFSWKLLTFNQREQSQFQLEMNVYCISWLRQIFEFDCCSCPSNISFKFINCCSPLVWTFLHKSTLYNVCAVPWECSVLWGISWVPWGCSVPWGDIMINVGGYLEYRGGISWVLWRLSWVPWGISWCRWGDIMSTMGVVQHGT